MRCPRCLSTSLIMYKEPNENSYLMMKAVGALGLLIIDVMRSERTKKRGRECVCQQCGYEWYSKKGELLEKYFEHLRPIFQKEDGTFYGNAFYRTVDGGRLLLQDDRVIISRPYRRDRIFYYETIVDVKRTEDPAAGCGWLTIRHTKNQNQPFPTNLTEAKKDKTTVCYSLKFRGFREAQSLLQAIIEENKKAGII